MKTIKIEIDCTDEACFNCRFQKYGHCDYFNSTLGGIDGLPPFVPCKRLPECLAAEVSND